ncbi:MAG: helix-turn-helix domain-containing protein [Bacteroidales bacterium]|nr:helix-turn-helix domain-containing protein [Bacteroidales bacterium]
MKDRIAHIMRAKNLKASDFAELLGIQPSGISHILSGRNQPSLDFVKKIKETFPEYNLDWIIFGKGPMTTSEPFKGNFTPTETKLDTPTPIVDPNNNPPASFIPVAEVSPSTEFPLQSIPVSDKPSVKSLFILYDDGTFENYIPK